MRDQYLWTVAGPTTINAAGRAASTNRIVCVAVIAVFTD
jgi:hypothetical protein